MRHIHGRNRFFLQAIPARVSNDTDDLPRTFIRHEIQRDPLSDRIFVSEEAACHRLINDDHQRCGRTVLQADIATTQNRNPHCAEEIGRYGKVVRGLPLVLGPARRIPAWQGSRAALDEKWHGNAAGIQRRSVHGGG